MIIVLQNSGRGVNAAFTLGRICDTEIGLKRVLKSPFISKMVSFQFHIFNINFQHYITVWQPLQQKLNSASVP